jgi:toxin ParE1/3/4
MIVVFGPSAEIDLERIADHVALDNAKRALNIVSELRQSCEQLASFPERFQTVLRYEKTGIRRRVHGNYLIFYRVNVSTIDIVHVLHGAMDYEKILFPDN